MISLGAFLCSYFLWIGSSEQINILKLNFLGNITGRTLGFTLLGLIFLFPILGINLLAKQKKIYKTGLIGLLSILISSLIGSALFFTNI